MSSINEGPTLGNSAAHGNVFESLRIGGVKGACGGDAGECRDRNDEDDGLDAGGGRGDCGSGRVDCDADEGLTGDGKEGLGGSGYGRTLGLGL